MSTFVIIHDILSRSKFLACLQITQRYWIRFQNNIVLPVILGFDLCCLYIGISCMRYHVGPEVCVITVDSWWRDELLLVCGEWCYVFRVCGLHVVVEAAEIIIVELQIISRRCKSIESGLLVICGAWGAQVMCLNIWVRSGIRVVGIDVDCCQLRDVLEALCIRLEILLWILNFGLETAGRLLVLSWH